MFNDTGLTGTYDLSLNWSSSLGSASDSLSSSADEPSLFTAIQDQLGLKLVLEKGPVKVLVIDHIEPPTAN